MSEKEDNCLKLNKDNNIILSIIIPLFNNYKLIKHCLDSIVEQINENVEVIIVNDGSTDNSGEICIEYSKKYPEIHYIFQENKGVSEARNTGMKESKGDWITFVDADDYVSDSFVECIIDNINENHDFLTFKMQYTKSRQAQRGVDDVFVKNIVYGRDDIEKIIKAIFSDRPDCIFKWGFPLRCACGKIFNRKFLYDNNILFPSGVRIGEDMIFMLNVMCNTKDFLYIPQTLYFYFLNTESVTNCYKPFYEEITIEFANAIQPWLEKNIMYEAYYKAYRLNDLIFYGKFDLFHPCNKNNNSKKRFLQLISNGEFGTNYESTKENKLFSLYPYTKRVLFWLAYHKLYFLVRCIFKLRYH